ncbi:hypothetical protein DMENIID0001_077060 [Sergentomyia squamirostris]
MGMILQITLQCMALNTGALLTLFLLGALIPKANSKGALVGSLTALVTTMILIIGSINKKPEPTLLFRTDGCIHNSSNFSLGPNSTLQFVENDGDSEELFWIFRLSYVYFGLVGTVMGVIVGYLTSLVSGGSRVRDQKLLATFVRRKLYSEDIKLTNINQDNVPE